MKTRVVMIQGTASSVGKSLITAGLCRIFKQDGYRVAPFKSQNMALNSFITLDGDEMGRAQVVQAEAAGLKPDVRMNPILLKPTTDQNAQVIIRGKVYGNMSAIEYHHFKPQLAGMVKEIYTNIAAENEIMVIEGAGSPAEINLKDNDIVNMGMAELADAPVLIVGDIDKGGVFAALAGTMLLLSDTERSRVQGVIINKFRGDPAILKPGVAMLEEMIKKPVLGVIPYTRFNLEDEDSLAERFTMKDHMNAAIEIASTEVGVNDIATTDVVVIKLPHLANFTDFNHLENIPGVRVRYVENCRRFGTPDLIILPGTKNTLEDLLEISRMGLSDVILEQHRQGAVLFGICGGYQMLGKEIRDPYGIESGQGKVTGLGLLDAVTTLQPAKTTTQVKGMVLKGDGLLTGLNGVGITGYEIHMGVTEFGDGCVPFIQFAESGTANGGVCNQAGNVFGTYLHGIFDNGEFTFGLINNLRRLKNLEPLSGKVGDFEETKEQQYDRLADLLRQNIEMRMIYQIMNTWGA